MAFSVHATESKAITCHGVEFIRRLAYEGVELFRPESGFYLLVTPVSKTKEAKLTVLGRIPEVSDYTQEVIEFPARLAIADVPDVGVRLRDLFVSEWSLESVVGAAIAATVIDQTSLVIQATEAGAQFVLRVDKLAAHKTLPWDSVKYFLRPIPTAVTP